MRDRRLGIEDFCLTVLLVEGTIVLRRRLFGVVFFVVVCLVVVCLVVFCCGKVRFVIDCEVDRPVLDLNRNCAVAGLGANAKAREKTSAMDNVICFIKSFWKG